MSTTETTVPPAEAWIIASVDHFTTGETIDPESQTGDEWSVEWRNPHFPTARVISTYAVMRHPVDGAGDRLDLWDVDVDEHETWTYAVDEMTETVVGTDPDDPWGTEVWSDRQSGDGSYLSYDTEEDADREAERMARREAGMTGIIFWDPSHVL